jgi:AP-3 complex subunit beta
MRLLIFTNLVSTYAQVVFAVAQLYYYLAPRAEMQIVGKAMTRLVRSHREIAHTVLHSIEAMRYVPRDGSAELCAET